MNHRKNIGTLCILISIYLLVSCDALSSKKLKHLPGSFEASRNMKDTAIREARQIKFQNRFQDMPESIESFLTNYKLRAPNLVKPYLLLDNPLMKSAINKPKGNYVDLDELVKSSEEQFNNLKKQGKDFEDTELMHNNSIIHKSTPIDKSAQSQNKNKPSTLLPPSLFISGGFIPNQLDFRQPRRILIKNNAVNLSPTNSSPASISKGSLVHKSFSFDEEDTQIMSPQTGSKLFVARITKDDTAKLGFEINYNNYTLRRKSSPKFMLSSDFNQPAKGNHVSINSHEIQSGKELKNQNQNRITSQSFQDSNEHEKTEHSIISEAITRPTQPIQRNINSGNVISSFSSYEHGSNEVSLPRKRQNSHFQIMSIENEFDTTPGQNNVLQITKNIKPNFAATVKIPVGKDIASKYTNIRNIRTSFPPNTKFINIRNTGTGSSSVSKFTNTKNAGTSFPPNSKQTNIRNTGTGSSSVSKFTNNRNTGSSFPPNSKQTNIRNTGTGPSSVSKFPNNRNTATSFPPNSKQTNIRNIGTGSSSVSKSPNNRNTATSFPPNSKNPNNRSTGTSQSLDKDKRSPLPSNRNVVTRFATSEKRFVGSESINKQIPLTSFSCFDYPVDGYYADIETNCKVFHICYSGRMASFVCPNRTHFSNRFKVCVWHYMESCF